MWLTASFAIMWHHIHMHHDHKRVNLRQLTLLNPQHIGHISITYSNIQIILQDHSCPLSCMDQSSVCGSTVLFPCHSVPAQRAPVQPQFICICLFTVFCILHWFYCSLYDVHQSSFQFYFSILCASHLHRSFVISIHVLEEASEYNYFYLGCCLLNTKEM